MRRSSGRRTGTPTQHSLKLQGEYMHRTEDGTLAFDITGQNLSGGYHSRQSGWYLQGVYQFMPRWRVGCATTRWIRAT